jgi:hypothetical protein
MTAQAATTIHMSASMNRTASRMRSFHRSSARGGMSRAYAQVRPAARESFTSAGVESALSPESSIGQSVPVRTDERLGGSPRRAPARRKHAAPHVIVFAVVIGLTSSGWLASATAAPLPVVGSSGGVSNTQAVEPTTEVLRSSFQGLRADAMFEWQTPPGTLPCVTTTASVSAKQGTSMVGPGEPMHQPTVQLDFLTLTGCSFPSLSGASGTAVLAPGAFQIDKTLGSAQLDATVQVRDSNSGTFPVALHVLWTGTGALSSLKNHSHFRFPDATTIVENVNGVTRAATATGTLSQLESLPFQEFAGAAVSAGLGDVSYSYLTIVH